MSENGARYIRCHTCGKLIEDNEAYLEGYCSPECTKVYRQCQGCGTYLKVENWDEGAFYCPDCRTIAKEETNT